MNTQDIIFITENIVFIITVYVLLIAKSNLKMRIEKLNYSLKVVTYKLSLKADELQELKHAYNKLKQSNNAAGELLQAKEKWLSPITVLELLKNPPKFKIGDKVGIATIENIEFRNYSFLQTLYRFLDKKYNIFLYNITVNEAKTTISEDDLINTYQVAKTKRTALKTREV